MYSFLFIILEIFGFCKPNSLSVESLFFFFLFSLLHFAVTFDQPSSPLCSIGKPQYTHVGEVIDGVDMRAEVALLSRNILIYGEMENSCYGDFCQYFNYDTFGGHIKV